MGLNIEKQVAAMKRMTVNELQAKYAEVFGEGTNGRHKQWLIKRIAWRMQANEEGGLSDRARRRALEIANDADLRMTPPRSRKAAPIVTARVHSPAENRLPSPGTVLTRQYKGATHQVEILTDGFSYQGEHYRSLSAVAKAITSTHWNGYHFFGLKKGVAK